MSICMSVCMRVCKQTFKTFVPASLPKFTSDNIPCKPCPNS